MATSAVDQITGNGETVAYKAPVRLATTGNIALSGLLTVDGVVTVADDRVGVIAQADQKENGIYIVSSGVWRRARDFDSSRDVTKGTRFAVTDGATLAGFEYRITTANPISIGTSNIVFARADLVVQAGVEVARAEAAADLAEDWAEGTVPGGVGTKSAKEWAAEAAASAGLLIPETVTANAYTPVLDDGNDKLKRLVDPTAVALTIPPNSAVAFSIGTVLSFEQSGAGPVTIAGDVGVTVRTPAGQSAVSAEQYSVFQLVKIATDEWLLFGALVSTQTGYLLGSTQVFTASGTWTKPAGCVAVEVEVVSGGAGGGGVAGQASEVAVGGGGGGGGYGRKFITSGLGPTEVITIGAGGAGGVGGLAGTNGGTSSFGAHVSVTGGIGGGTMVSGTSHTTSTGGAGGIASGGSINAVGGAGTRGIRLSATTSAGSGTGGSSHFGNGGQNNINNAGAPGTGYGGGGGGGAANALVNRDGGAGTSGIIIVREYY